MVKKKPFRNVHIPLSHNWIPFAYLYGEKSFFHLGNNNVKVSSSFLIAKKLVSWTWKVSKKFKLNCSISELCFDWNYFATAVPT